MELPDYTIGSSIKRQEEYILAFSIMYTTTFIT